jgi:uncharacterized membrane protein
MAASIDAGGGPPPASQWWVRHETESYGPYTEEQMRTYVLEGRILAETPVRFGDEADWQAAAEHPRFAPVFHQVVRSMAVPPLPEQSREEAPNLSGTLGGPSAARVGPAGIPLRDLREAELPPGETTTMAHVVYGLYLFHLFVIGIVVAYLKRRQVEGTWLASHYQWQIRTFWLGFLFAAIALVLSHFLVGILLFALLDLWLLWRILKGWFLLGSSRPIENPTAWF